MGLFPITKLANYIFIKHDILMAQLKQFHDIVMIKKHQDTTIEKIIYL